MTASLPLPAASLVLIRQGNRGPEVLMQQRPESMRFGPGKIVFPGGKLSSDDYAHRDRRLFGPHRIAAIRETFEETGVLLAKHKAGNPLKFAEISRLARQYRERLDHGTLKFSRFLKEQDLAPETSRLIDYAHWETPPARSMRFDTAFFLAVSQRTVALNQGSHESEELFWKQPEALLGDHQALQRLMFPTRMILERMASLRSVGAIVEAASRYKSVQIGTALFEQGYAVAKHEIEAAGYDTRFFEADGRLWG